MFFIMVWVYSFSYSLLSCCKAMNDKVVKASGDLQKVRLKKILLTVKKDDTIIHYG